MSSPSVNIRQLSDKDVLIYRDIRLESLKKIPDAFGSSYEEESQEEDAFFIHRINSGAIFGCFVEDQLVGVTGFYTDNKIKCAHVANIWGVFVKEEFRGKKIGKQLLEETIKNLPSRIEQVRLSVGAHNIWAKNLYEDMGFQECGLEERVIKINDKYYDEILMVKFIK